MKRSTRTTENSCGFSSGFFDSRLEDTHDQAGRPDLTAAEELEVMGKICVHCEKKIGFLKTPIEGIYCTYDCRNAARDQLRESEQKSQERVVEAQRKAAEHAAESQRQVHAEQAAMQVRGRCPKCSAPWAFSNSGAPHGSHSGKCSKCLFTAEFASIELCPVCKCQSLVVSIDADARCPRCKYRGDSRAVSRTA